MTVTRYLTQSEKTISELLADIGVRHEPSKHHGCRRLLLANGRELDHMHAEQACSFLAVAECAA